MLQLKIEKTERGFTFAKFKDYYNSECSIQLSSLADDRCIWLGVDEPKAKRMTDSGWKDYPLPENVMITTRMHLNIEQVELLLPILQNFVETGELENV